MMIQTAGNPMMMELLAGVLVVVEEENEAKWGATLVWDGAWRCRPEPMPRYLFLHGLAILGAGTHRQYLVPGSSPTNVGVCRDCEFMPNRFIRISTVLDMESSRLKEKESSQKTS